MPNRSPTATTTTTRRPNTMATKASARLRLGVDREDFDSQLDKAAKRVATWSTALNQSLEVAAKAWGAVSRVVTASVDIVGGWVKAANEAERADTRWLAALQR